MPQNEPHKLTKSGLERYEAEYDHLIKVDIPENKIALQEARDQGDLSENSAYDVARADQKKFNDRLDLLTDIIKNHTLIEEEWITVKFPPSDNEEHFQVTGTLETDPLKKMISVDCPLAKALKGKKAGETVTFTSGTGKKVQVQLIEGNL